ncbi:LPS export ABC transporter periplasmic protein LptC [Hymenobacter psychrophilus]|uniref:LPS export ABC transporter protein LptC n=1 Tax=Hymenobacter psychrophilus TaxID=651662 RepID=A0A1H3GKX1_9BACT|nr:LPS export ABC transporter periplasmic protein LptC [Hymenobacter psychrophilus]SDY02929.1 LPS export ABC transporter protein LptC [Hymenobacter psychrophilus]
MKSAEWIPGWLVLSTALLAAGCHKAEEAPTKVIDYQGPTVETRNVLLLYSDSARLRVRLKAPLEQGFESGDRVYPEGVALTFMDQEGRAVANTITGKYGRYQRNQNLFTIRGDVRVTNVPKQQRMNTEEAFYDQNKASIYTKPETAIKVTTPTEVLTGRGLTANQDFSRYRILTPTGVFTMQEDAPAPAATVPLSTDPAPQP